MSMKKIKAGLMLIIMICPVIFRSVTAEAAAGFTDVPDTKSYYGAVNWASDLGLVRGTSESEFSPEAPCTRYQFAVILYKYAGRPAANGTIPFTDIPEDASYRNAVIWAYNSGIISGTTKTTFSPHDPVKRYQAVQMLYKMNGRKPVSAANPFTDVSETDSFYKAVMWAVRNGITKGTTDTTFSPQKDCLRYQLVVFLWKYNNYRETVAENAGFRAAEGDKTIYLCFTLATEPGYTPVLLDVFASKGVKATFFITVNEYLHNRYVYDSPGILRRIAAEGHTIGFHGFNHVDTHTMSDQAFLTDIYQTKAAVSGTLGYEYPAFFYIAPFESYFERDAYLLHTLGMAYVHHNFAYADLTPGLSAEAAFANLAAGMAGGSVYLLHVNAANVGAVSSFIDYARAHGYRFAAL